MTEEGSSPGAGASKPAPARGFRLSIISDLRPKPGTMPSQRDYEEFLAEVALADALGYRAVRLIESHGHADGMLASPLTLLAGVAPITTRLRLTTYILPLPLYRWRRVIEDATIVDLVSGGRVELGVSFSNASTSPSRLSTAAKQPASWACRPSASTSSSASFVTGSSYCNLPVEEVLGFHRRVCSEVPALGFRATVTRESPPSGLTDMAGTILMGYDIETGAVGDELSRIGKHPFKELTEIDTLHDSLRIIEDNHNQPGLPATLFVCVRTLVFGLRALRSAARNPLFDIQQHTYSPELQGAP